MREAKLTITNSPPARYKPTLSGVSRSAALPMDWMPPMITSHVSTAISTPEAQVGTPNCVFQTSAIELVCVNGVVVKRRHARNQRVRSTPAPAT